jgi:enoyl-CoA hydratase/carnithine racemase
VTIKEETAESIVTITVDRPASLNAMDTTTYGEVTEALKRFDADPKLSVAIVTGSGDRAFSAGADLKEMHSNHEPPDAWQPWHADRWDMGLRVSKPLIAAIDGYALAGGLELALFCDIRIATPRSQFGAPEVKWSLLHGFGAQRLPAVVGLGNAMMLLLSAEFIDAEEALRIGLVNRLVEPDSLIDEARSLAQKIAGNSPDALRMTKELAMQSLGAPLDQTMRLYRSYMDALAGSEEQLRRTGEFGDNGEGED